MECEGQYEYETNARRKSCASYTDTTPHPVPKEKKIEQHKLFLKGHQNGHQPGKH